MEKEMENSDGNSNSIRNDEENQKEQVEGGGSDSGAGIGNSDMEVDHDALDVMDEALLTVADDADVEGILKATRPKARNIPCALVFIR